MSVDKSNIWKAWLPISKTTSKIRPEDVKWFADRGIAKTRLHGALTLLGFVRKRVLPILQLDDFVVGITMLVHEHPKTKKPAIDLTLELVVPMEKDSVRSILKSGWTDVVPAPVTKSVAGIDTKQLKHQAGAPRVVANLTMAYLNMLDAFRPSATDVEVLKQVGQCLHLFSNMSQLEIS